MTHQHYRQFQLEAKTRSELWTICKQRGLKCFRKSSDCIITILESHPQKIENISSKSVQETTKDLLASESDIRAVEISFYDHEIYAGDKLIASITHDSDDFVTQRWVVMVNGLEIHRANTWGAIRCLENHGNQPVHI
jgi:hypothetical protein